MRYSPHTFADIISIENLLAAWQEFLRGKRKKQKGTHKALNRFRSFAYKVSKNHTKTCWILKCDIRKFFANIDHGIPLSIFTRHIPDPDILWLLREIIGSFNSGGAFSRPLGAADNDEAENACASE